MEAMLVFSTFPDSETARKAAALLVERHLAACVNLLPGISSIYRWQGKVEESSEVLLIVKTTHTAYSRLESALKACHPYELPEIIAIKTDTGLPDYLKWIVRECDSDIQA